MAAANAQPVSIEIEGGQQVSGLLQSTNRARACYILAHGAGAGMTHPFMTAAANELAQRGIATLRYNFPYMDKGSKRPDSPRTAQATVRAAVAHAGRLLPLVPLFAGGKSFGGRMTSQAQAAAPLPGVRGLVFLGFPLHAPGRPSDERAQHLYEIRIPMLFLQGTRDEFADFSLLEPLIGKLGATASLVPFQDANHSFHVPARTGRTDAQIMSVLLDTLADWIDTVLASRNAG
ncbi:MAG TPA: alpha/beta family hydrolase [Burkholderiales bacterium]|nr:alpha/beta family hydrolase [Burkholderiales bacterium]